MAQNRTRLEPLEGPPIKVFVRWTSAAFDFEQARFCSELHQDKTYWCQGSKGIRQWLINFSLCTSPMVLHKFIPSVDYNYWLNV